jgi:hypothetical protein
MALCASWGGGELQEKPYNRAKNLSSVVGYSRAALPASSHPLKERASRCVIPPYAAHASDLPQLPQGPPDRVVRTARSPDR